MKILKQLNTEDLIFFDIETARVAEELIIDSPLFDAWAWKKRKEGITDNKELQETYKKESGLYPEFAKIVSIVIGKIVEDELVLKTYDSEKEEGLLNDFNNALGALIGQNKNTKLVGFFSSGFDTPFAHKRMMINGIEPNDILDTFDDKPWLINSNIDVAILWKGGSYNRASLLAIATAFGLPSPKDEVKAYEVGDVYWEQGKKGLEAISLYCGKDVLTLANIFRKIRQEPLLVIGELKQEEEPVQLSMIESINNGGPFGMQQKIELEKQIDTMEEGEQSQAISIFEAMSCKKRSKVTKAYIKELRKKYGE